MCRKIFISVAVLFLLQKIYVPLLADEKTVAVLDFDNNSILNPQQYQPLSGGLAEIMITELGRVKSLRIVERRRIKTIIDEIKANQSGLVEGSSFKAGRMLGADYLLFGSYMVNLNKKIRIDVRVVDVETGLTIKSEEVTGKPDQIISLVRKLGKRLLKGLDIRISRKEEKILNESKKINMKAVVLFSKGVRFEDSGDFEKAEQFYESALKLEPDFSLASKRIEIVRGKKKLKN